MVQIGSDPYNLIYFIELLHLSLMTMIASIKSVKDFLLLKVFNLNVKREQLVLKYKIRSRLPCTLLLKVITHNDCERIFTVTLGFDRNLTKWRLRWPSNLATNIRNIFVEYFTHNSDSILINIITKLIE